MRALHVPIAMAAFALVAIVGVLARPALPIDETRYLTVAWEMRTTGDFLVPHLNGELYSHKPPLLFWLTNLVWTVFGVSETAARLVAPAFGVASIGATGLLARRLWPQEPGIAGLAALAFAGFGSFALFAGLTMFDAMLTLAVVLGVLALEATARSPRAWIGFGAALALGAFAKGPVILVHLAPLALLTPLWNGVRPAAMLRGVGIALAVGLGIVALWLVPAVVLGGPEYREAVLWKQHAGRVTDSFAHLKPWWFFLALLPVLLWPWAWSAGLWRRIGRLAWSERGLRLAAIWAGATLLLFSLISGKQTHYLLPALPAVALMIARALTLGEEPLRAPLAGLVPAALGIALIAAALGIGTDARTAQLVEPAWAIALTGLVLIGLGALALRLRGTAIAGLGLALPMAGALVFVLAAPGAHYDANRIGAVFAAAAPHEAGMLASNYHGEFNFAGRLAQPVVIFADLAEATAWLAADPGRVLLARLDKAHPEMPPIQTLAWRNRPYGLWTVTPDGPTGDPAPEPGSAS